MQRLKVISLIGFSIYLTLVINSSNACAFDKRVPLFISPPKKLAVKMIAVNSNQRIEQYNPLNQSSISKNSMNALRTQIRYSPTPRLELAFESLYFQKRTLDVTNPMSVTTRTIDSSGFGDSSFQLTYLLSDARKTKFGLLIGAEIKVPTGDQEDGLGTGSYDSTLRSTLSLKTKVGFPYVSALYTWTGEGKKNGVETDEADELFLNLGLKSKRWRGFSFNSRIYYKMHLSDAQKFMNSKVILSEGHKTKGAFLEMSYALNKRFELGLLLEKAWAEDHPFTSNGIPMTSRNNEKNRAGLIFTMLW